MTASTRGEPLIPRVRGLETEYGLSVREQVPDPTGVAPQAMRWRRVGSDEAARRLFAPVVAAHSATNVFLRNGGRLYLDVGSHPEYATPECRSLSDLIVHDRAGDAIVNQLADRVIANAAGEGVALKVSIFKNNLDSHGNSYGSHENYQIGRDLDYQQLADALTPFLATRQLLCGAGRWVRTARESWFELSQRAEHMWEPLASSTTRSRPFINTRDEPHADPSKFRRLHVVVGDSTLSQRTLLLRVGATELMLRAVEAGVDFSSWTLADPTAAIRSAARDLRGRRPLPLANGEVTTPLDLQRGCWQAVEPFIDRDAELTAAHRLWGEVLDAVADDRLERIEADIDWVAKYRMMQAWRERHGSDDARMAQLDLAWHDIRPGQGLFGLAEDAGRMRTVVAPDAVAAAIDQPPSDTRASLRGRFVRAAQAQRREHSVDWMVYSVHDLPDGVVRCPDPLAATDARVDELIARMASEPRRRSGLGGAG